MSLQRVRGMLCPQEGLVLTVQPCPAGYPSIGYGHKLTEQELADYRAGRGPFVHGITKETASDILDQDIGDARAAVLRHVRTLVNENQLDALTCLAFNAGAGVFLGEAPLMMAALQRQDWAEAAKQMLDIDHARDPHTGQMVVLNCLKVRRQLESEMFLSPVDGIDPETVLANVGVSIDDWRAGAFAPHANEQEGA